MTPSNGRVRPSRNSRKTTRPPGTRRWPSAKPAIVREQDRDRDDAEHDEHAGLQQRAHVRGVEARRRSCPTAGASARPARPGRCPTGAAAVTNRLRNGSSVNAIMRTSRSRPVQASRGAAIIGCLLRVNHWIGRTQASTSTMSTTARAEASPTSRFGEGQLVDLQAGHHGRVAGAALGGDVDDVEAGQGGDHGHGDADADLLAQAGQGDGEELPHTARRRRAGRPRTAPGRSCSCRPAAAACTGRAAPTRRSCRPRAARCRSRRARPGSPRRARSRESSWLTTPVEASSQLHAMPAATSGMTCGRNSTVRATAPSAAGGDPPDHRGDQPGRARPGSR